MRIVYLTDQTYLHGGVEKVLSQKANYLADVLDDEVTIITYNQQQNKSCYSFSQKIKTRDIGVNYEIAKSYFDFRNLKKIPQHFLALKKVLQQLKPDVIISCSIGPDFYFIPLIEKHIPKIKEFHSSCYFVKQNTTTAKSKLFQKLNLFIEKKYHQLVVLNESEKSYYSNKKIEIIPNPAEITGRRADLTCKKIMAAGRISPVKGFGDLIEIFARLAAEFPTWELHFFGEDYLDTQRKLQQKVEEYQLADQIKFKGVSVDLKNEMKNYSIYALTSETECFPMVLLESMSVGLPVISYDSPTGPKHILKNRQDSFLIPYKNLDIFTNKLRLLMQNENLRYQMGDKGIENVKRFSIDKVMQQWKILLNALLN